MPARNLHRVPEHISVEAAPLIEPLAGCMSGASKARIVPGDTVVVLGGGTIGLLYLQIYRAAGAGRVIVVEPREARGERALALGADLVLDPTRDDLEARVLQETEIGADVVIDAVGAGFVAGLSLLRLGGSMVVFGLDARVREPVQQFQITMKELKIFGSLSGAFGFRQAIRFMAAGGVRSDLMVTHHFGLDDARAAIETLRGGDAIKVLIRPHQ
jgi:threonine dehydrogenase-like Zn-dependent dehydrogenase